MTNLGSLLKRVKFPNSANARELLSTPDDVTDRWSVFDIQSRLRLEEATEKSKLFQFIRDQVLPWRPSEIELITDIVGEIDKQFDLLNFELNLPRVVYFIKTTLNEEGGFSGYTRSNYIVINQNLFEDKKRLKHLIIHEVFHILTRADPDLRREMYKVIGFEICNEIQYPEDIKDLRITNPDSPKSDSYITLKKDGRKIECTMILYADGPYRGGGFPEYLKFGFLVVDGPPNQKAITLCNGKPTIYSLEEVEGFFEQVGSNTDYIIQPEEILAENFTHAVLYPNLSIIREIQKIPNPDL